MGRDCAREVFLASRSIEFTPEVAQLFHQSREQMWSSYSHILPSCDKLLQFCGLPAAVIFSMQPNACILIRDGIPCGAVLL